MEDDQSSATNRLIRTPKEGERILGPTRRPDGTLRKPIRIRAGYVPQDEVAIYQSKGALLKKAQPEHPPGFDPAAVEVGKAKTKSAKRNERKKEKKLQAAHTSSDGKGKDLAVEEEEHRLDSVEAIAEQMNILSVSSASELVSSSRDQIETSKLEDSGPDIDKRIRALKKKIRLAEAQLKDDEQSIKPEQSEKMAKVEGWREELKVLEDKKAHFT